MTDGPSHLRVRIVRALVAALPGDVGRTYRRNVIQLAVELERENELRWRDVVNCATGGLRLYLRFMVNVALAASIIVAAAVTLARVSLPPSSPSSRSTYPSSPSVIAYSLPASRLGITTTTRSCHAVEGSTSIVLFVFTPTTRAPLTFHVRGACVPRLDQVGRSAG